jgi:hypothetical protein
MRAVVLHEYGGPEKLKFEDNVPEPQISRAESTASPELARQWNAKATRSTMTLLTNCCHSFPRRK